MKTIYVNWYGPFTKEDIDAAYDSLNKSKKSLLRYGLYAWTGKIKNQRGEQCLQYIGITSWSYKGRFGDKTHKHWSITKDKRVWLGKIDCNKREYIDEMNEAEHILVSCCQSPLNDTKYNPPAFDCAVISRFFKKDMTPYIRIGSIIREIPEVVIWDSTSEEFRYTEKLTIYTQK